MISKPGILITSAVMAAWYAVSQAADITCSKHIISNYYPDDSDGMAVMDVDNDGNESSIQRLLSKGFNV